MVKPHLSLVVLAHLIAATAVSAQTSYVFQLPGSATAQTGAPQITGVGDNNASRNVTSSSTTALLGAFKVVATPNGTKFYILTSNGVLSANATLSTLTPLSAASGVATDAQVTPDGKYLFVVASQLYIVDTTTDTLAANANTGLPPGATPVAVAFSHDSKTAWILSNTNSASTMTTVDLGTLRSSSTVLNLSPTGTSMVLSPGNLLYVTTVGSIIYEIDPLKLAVTTLGQIDVPGMGIPGPLQFTPDGTNAYFVNSISCGTCSPYFQLNTQSHAISSWLPSDGSAPPVVDQVLVAGNNRVLGWSRALTQLWDISPSSLAPTPTVIGLLPTNTVIGAAISNEVPSSRFLYLLFPDLSFDRITLADNNAVQQSTLNLLNGTLLQFVPIPAQSSTAIQPLSLSLINSSQSLLPSATAVLTGQVVDSVGRPVMGASAAFSADPASGVALTTNSVTTTAGGWAETTAIAPAVPGSYTVTLCSPSCGSGGVSANFTLGVSNNASGGATSQMFIYAGDGQLLSQFESTVTTGVPLTVEIADQNGNPLAGVPVTFQINNGGIGVLPQAQGNPSVTTTTDQFGLAKTNYVTARIPTNQSIFQSTVHASSSYGDLDFYEITYTDSVSNSSLGPYSRPLPISRIVSVPQGGILPAGITTQTFTGDNQVIPNVGLRIADPSNPTLNSTVASCAGLTRADNTGVSTCNVLAICQPNITPPQDFSVVLQIGELLPYRFTIHVTQGVASVLQPISALNQAGNPGSSFTLRAQVNDGCGQPIAGASGLTWGILPGSAPAQLVNPSSSSDSGGSVATGVTLGQTAGVVLIKLSGSGLTPIIFRLTNQIVITSLSVVPPLPPSVTVGQQFQPLAFVVGNASNNPVAGVLVNFTASGGATLSPSSATTNQQGVVQTTVTAGSTAGTILVTATADGLSTTATLSAHALGPALTANSFTNAASGATGMTPCGFVTVTGRGVASGAQGVVAAITFFGAYPYSLAGLSITVNGTLVPIQAVANDQFGQRANFQAPCELTGSSATVVVTVNGASTTITGVPVSLVQPGIFTYTGSNNKVYGAVIRAVDGTYVTATNPARQGEKVYVVVTGLGQATPTLITNSAGTGSQNVNLPTAVFLSGRGLPGISAQYLFGWVGAYLVEFQVPSDSAIGPDQTLAVVETSADGSNFLGVSNTVLMPAVSASDAGTGGTGTGTGTGGTGTGGTGTGGTGTGGTGTGTGGTGTGTGGTGTGGTGTGGTGTGGTGTGTGGTGTGGTGTGTGTGTSSALSPTQDEINSWIARGNYVSGQLSLTRSTAFTTTDSFTGGAPTTSSSKTDSFSGQFTKTSGADLSKLLNNQLPSGFPVLVPAVGTCSVYSIASLTNPFPNITTVNLDAGAQLTSNGPNGTQLALRQNSQGGPIYSANNVPNTYLAAGGYALSGPGGADVGVFSGNLNTVADLVVTNPSNFNLINRSGGVTVNWTGGEQSNLVFISGSSATLNVQTQSISGSAFICSQNVSAGQFTVPASILTQLGASAITTVGNLSTITRGSFSVTASGKGARFTSPSGVDILTANNSWVWSFTPQYQ